MANPVSVNHADFLATHRFYINRGQPLSKLLATMQAMRNFPYCFGKPPETNKPRNPAVAMLFNISCVKCESASLKIIGTFEEESGELAVYLVCPRCNLKERLKVG